ncbi:MAG: DUF4250 domain-containing protein [Lachnospiraceae bacterium]|nr:DUF4250 domain-containing protein [Lachnospiraceae bacterium]
MAIDNLPKDSMMLLSFVNTRLRDEKLTLNELAAQFDVDAREIEERLGKIDYKYDIDKRRFV